MEQLDCHSDFGVCAFSVGWSSGDIILVVFVNSSVLMLVNWNTHGTIRALRRPKTNPPNRLKIAIFHAVLDDDLLNSSAI